eukprot:2738934-Prymnesium_polylepis.2
MSSTAVCFLLGHLMATSTAHTAAPPQQSPSRRLCGDARPSTARTLPGASGVRRTQPSGSASPLPHRAVGRGA